MKLRIYMKKLTDSKVNTYKNHHKLDKSIQNNCYFAKFVIFKLFFFCQNRSRLLWTEILAQPYGHTKCNCEFINSHCPSVFETGVSIVLNCSNAARSFQYKTLEFGWKSNWPDHRKCNLIFQASNLIHKIKHNCGKNHKM